MRNDSTRAPGKRALSGCEYHMNARANHRTATGRRPNRACRACRVSSDRFRPERGGTRVLPWYVGYSCDGSLGEVRSVEEPAGSRRDHLVKRGVRWVRRGRLCARGARTSETLGAGWTVGDPVLAQWTTDAASDDSRWGCDRVQAPSQEGHVVSGVRAVRVIWSQSRGSPGPLAEEQPCVDADNLVVHGDAAAGWSIAPSRRCRWWYPRGAGAAAFWVRVGASRRRPPGLFGGLARSKEV